MIALSDEWEQVRAGRHDVGTVLDLAAGFRDERTASGDADAGVGPARGSRRGRRRPTRHGGVSRAGSRRCSPRRWLRSARRPRPNDTDEVRSLRASAGRGHGRHGARSGDAGRGTRPRPRGARQPGSVEPTLLTVVVRLAAIEGDAALYDRYLARSKAAVDPEERYQYLYALTAFANPDLVRRTMALVASPDVRSQDAKIVLANMIGNARHPRARLGARSRAAGATSRRRPASSSATP